MSRYYFDVDDGTGMAADEIGLEFNSLVEVREEAIRALPDIAREVLPDGDRRTIKTCVRDESGRMIFQASLALEANWL